MVLSEGFLVPGAPGSDPTYIPSQFNVAQLSLTQLGLGGAIPWRVWHGSDHLVVLAQHPGMLGFTTCLPPAGGSISSSCTVQNLDSAMT